jgi:hypothetical protein
MDKRFNIWNRYNILLIIDPFVVIPHTIIYKYQKPCYWYFTSKQDGKLKKKSSMNLKNEHIREVFTKKVSKSGIVAYYIYKKINNYSKYEMEQEELNKNNNQDDNLKNNKSSYIIEYFDLKKFGKDLYIIY